jgi:predicted HTH transcriptional regulator
MVEIFRDCMEVTNSGKPLVAIECFVDAPPCSRNEASASLMRRMEICEERGSGVDKLLSQATVFQLPAPWKTESWHIGCEFDEVLQGGAA